MGFNTSFIFNAVHEDVVTSSGWTDVAVDHNFNKYPDLILVYREQNGVFHCDQEFYPGGQKCSDLFPAEGDDTLNRCYVPVRNSKEGPVNIRIELYTDTDDVP